MNQQESPLRSAVAPGSTVETDEMARLYEQTFKTLEEGTVVTGIVVAVQTAGVVVDVGYKAEGLIPGVEFSAEELSTLKPGDSITVYLEEWEDLEGVLRLSKEKAAKMKVWEHLERAHEKGEVVDGKVLSKVKGGMMVDIGVKAFLPGSQIDLHPIKDLDIFVGKTYPMKVIKINQRRGNVVVSRRALLEESRDKRRKTALSTLAEGQIVEGVVKNLTDYGAFIDLGGVDGLLHITDMSWERIGHPSEILKVGERVSVMVLKYDKETGRVSLGLKQKGPDPWTQVNTKYPIGSRVQGKVVSVTDYGAFVELEPGVDGLVHVSEMSWRHEMRHPSKIVSVGDRIEAVVLNLDKDNRKISLGMKQLMPNPWDIIETKYPVGTRISGKIKSLTNFGAFVGLEEGIDGLIHVSDMSWTKRIAHPSELFKKGQEVEAVVLRIDREKERLSLGYRQTQNDPWERDIPQKYHVGDVVKGKIARVADFGLFLELEDGVEGFIHVSETHLDPTARMEDAMQVGDVIRAQIVKMDTAERKIALSIRALTGGRRGRKKKGGEIGEDEE
jgi:small subunit ribosomal protein S1